MEPNDQEAQEEPTQIEGGTDVTVTPDPPTGDPPEERQTRKERREGRGRDMAAELRESRERTDRAEREAREAREAVAELRGRFDESRRAPEPKPGETPEERRLAAIDDEMETAIAEMGAGTPATAAAAAKRFHALRKEESRLVARLESSGAIRESEERVSRSMPQQMPPQMASLHADYPFLGDGKSPGNVIANGHVARLVALEKRNMDDPAVRYATLREGAALAARDLGLSSGSKPPTQVERDRLSGTRGGDSGAGNAGAVKVRLSAAQMKLAELSFRDLSPAEAHQKWWREIGVKAASK